MGLRDSVLTINPNSKTTTQRSYMTRSKGKTMCEENDSSEDDIREMLRDIEKGENGANPQKSKVSSK